MKKISLIAGSAFITLVLLEICLTLLFYFKDIKQELIHLDDTVDLPYLYYGFSADSSKGRNADGLFSNAVREKSKDVYRVAIVGGSVACNLGNALHADGSTLLQKYFKDEFKAVNIEFVNAGIHGYVAEQEFLLCQLILKKYKPDLIISLDGYNDLQSFKLNRNYAKTIKLPPQNYRDFTVIDQGKFRKHFLYRFSGLFKNTFRMADFVKNYINGINNYDYKNLTEDDYASVAETYKNILVDMRDFCQVKGTSYISFLQPIRYYDDNALGFMKTKDEAPELCKLYNMFESQQGTLGNAHSLTQIFNGNLSYYTDNCHVNQSGNEILAKAIVKACKSVIENDSAFIVLQAKQ
jgi:lysophospholipase L1-like esterase